MRQSVESAEPGGTTPEVIGRYVLHAPIAQGGMATIYIGRLVGAEGFHRIVAIKKLHPGLAQDPDFVAMLLDEARIASRIGHPNVVPVLDVVAEGEQIILVQEYVHGVPLNVLARNARRSAAPMPVPIVVAIGSGILAGLHAAHETRDEAGTHLGIVHRDVSPQNILLSIDGTPKLVDFGIAKASLSSHITREGVLKGKVGYMAPEQVRGSVTVGSDLYSLGVVLWECLANRRLHQGQSDAEILVKVLTEDVPNLTHVLNGASMAEPRWREIQALEAVIMRALARSSDDRFASAADMLHELSSVVQPAQPFDIAAWLRDHSGEYLVDRDRLLAQEETSWRHWQTSRPDPLETRSAPPTRSEMRPTSQVSDIVSKPPPFRVGRRTAIAAALFGVLASAALILFGLRHVAPETPARVAASTPGASEASPQPGLPPPSPTTANIGPATPPPLPELTGYEPRVEPKADTAHHAAPWYPPWAPAQPSARALPSAQPAVTASAAAKNCDPPFYFEGGRKVFKRECL